MKPSQPIDLKGTRTTIVEVWRWGQELERLHARLAPRFVRPEPRKRALAFLKGIVSTTERKNGWHLASQHALDRQPFVPSSANNHLEEGAERIND